MSISLDLPRPNLIQPQADEAALGEAYRAYMDGGLERIRSWPEEDKDALLVALAVQVARMFFSMPGTVIVNPADLGTQETLDV